MPTCPACVADNPEGARFCNSCGSKLLIEPPREERKVITALFCDLVGSTELGERMDHEDVAHLLSDYQALCRSRVESHGGVVEKFIGDAVVGVFGVPAAHEDDPERAVRAALRIVQDMEASDLGLQVRIGLNTGEALVRLDVDPRSGEGFAAGDTLNTAARLEAAAPVMGVAVGEATHRASAHAIVYDELEPVSAKGKAEPVAAWQALRPVARVSASPRDASPFVGRDLELQVLIQLAERSRTRASVEFATIVGDPGLGKSRLVRELRRRIDDLPELVIWREGRCLPYGDGISFWALGEIVKAQAGILETDGQQQVADKLDVVVTEPDPQLRAWLKDRLAPLVGLETTTSPPDQHEADNAWRTFLESLARQAPTVLVIEDLHWADSAFVAFLDHLVERAAGVPLCVVITARPELEERHPSWPPGRRSTVLSLAPLADADVSELIAASFDDASEELTQVVLERSGGSPLYAEQLAAMLREQALPIAGGAPDVSAIPTSVQALIAARIDVLPPEAKRVLMEASVVGRTFWSGALETFGEHSDLGDALAELVRREFCRPVLPSTMIGDDEFSFWHALVRDVAYAELTKAERARMHTATARWIVERAGQAMGEDAEIVVHHIDAACDLGSDEDLGDLLRLALLEAGRSAARTDVTKAVGIMQRTLTLVGTADPDRSDVAIRLARALEAQGRFAEAVAILEPTLQGLLDAHDLERATDAAITLGLDYWSAGDRVRRDAVIERMRTRMEGVESPAAARLLSVDAMAAMVDRDLDRGLDLARRAQELAGVLGVEPPARALEVIGMCELERGERSGELTLREAAAAFSAEGDLVGAGAVLFNLAACLAEFEPRRSLSVAQESIQLAERAGAEASAWSGRAGRLPVIHALGHYDEVVEEAGEVYAWARAHGDVFVQAVSLENLALVGLDRGDPRVDPEDLVTLFRRMGLSQGALTPAAICVASGDTERARAFIREALAGLDSATAFDAAVVAVQVGEVDGIRQLIADADAFTPARRVHRLAALATLAEYDGDLAAARDSFVAAYRELEGMEARSYEARVLQALGRVLLRMGETGEANLRLLNARALWVEMEATVRVAEVDQLLESHGE